MFGHEWEKADGTIVAARQLNDHGSYENAEVWEFVIDVRPLGQPHAEPITRAQVHQPRGDQQFWAPSVGDEVTVEIDKDGKVRFDRHDPRISYYEHRKAERQWEKDRFNAALEQPPGT
jgi:hypothetical protein